MPQPSDRSNDDASGAEAGSARTDGCEPTVRVASGCDALRRVEHRGHAWQRLILALLRVRIAIRGRQRPLDPGQVRRHLWSDNTRRMGVRFSERVRDVWRSRWIRVRPGEDE